MKHKKKQINFTHFHKFFSTKNNLSYINKKQAKKIELSFCIGWFLSNLYTVLSLILLFKCFYDDRVWSKGSANIKFDLFGRKESNGFQWLHALKFWL